MGVSRVVGPLKSPHPQSVRLPTANMAGRLLISLAILTSFVNSTDINFNCPDGWVKDVYRCYKYYDQALEFPDAEKYCNVFGANLASPGDYSEHTFIGTNVVRDTADTKYWIGLTREQSSPTTSNTNQDAKWTSDLATTVKMNEIGFWGPNQPIYSTTDIYTYVERVLTTWYPYKFRMYLLPKWSVVAGFVCQRRACLDNQLICNNGKCALGTLCDGKDDCGDFSDESSCTNSRVVDGVTYKSEVQTAPSSISISSSLYVNNLRQQWFLKADIKSVIKFTITTMNLERNVDWLRVWAGAATVEQSDLVETLTGVSGNGKSYYSYNNLMLITFDTDATTMSSGFTATWTKETATPVYNGIVGTFCPTTVTLAAGSINTRTIRTWSITTGDTFSIVTLKISKLKVPQNAGQFVYILNGADSTGMELIPSWADYAKTDYVMSLTNGMTVHLTTESELLDAEFVFSYWSGCDITLEQDSGVVVSPGQPTGQMYPNNLNCKFTLKSTDAATMLQLKNDGNVVLGTTTDTVKIWTDATATSGTPAYTATSTSAAAIDPATIRGTNMLVQFTSDQATTATGFKILFGKGCTLAGTPVVTNNIGETYVKTCTNMILGQAQFTGSSVTLYCQYDGWRLTDASGAIVTESPTCINMPCGTTQTVANGYPVSQTGNMVTWECYTGYGLTNSPQACTNGVWGTTPVCTASTCANPTLTDQLSVAHDPITETAYNVGNLAKYSCDAGYEMATAPPWARCDSVSGNNIFRYLTSQTAASPVPTCIAAKCPAPVVANAVLSPVKLFYDAPAEMVTVTCASGYMPTAGVMLTCTAANTWTGTPPTCTDIDECSAASGNPCNAPNTCKNTAGSYTCTCDAGFVLNTDGSSGPTCDNINECNDDPKACKPSGATPYMCTDVTPTTVGGAPFTCTCATGYEYNAATYLCDKKPCALPASSTNLVILANTATTYVQDDTIHVHCKIGFMPLTVTEVTCADGAWTNLPTCTDGQCTVPALSTTTGIIPASLSPTAGMMVNYDASLTIMCNAPATPAMVMKKCVYDVATQTYTLNLGTYLVDGKVACPVPQCSSTSIRLPSSVTVPTDPQAPVYSGVGTVSVMCADNTVMMGMTGSSVSPTSATNSVELKCTDGLWDVNTIRCTGGAVCQDPGFPPGGSTTATGQPSDTAVFSCTTEGYGFKPPTGNVENYERICLSSGTNAGMYAAVSVTYGSCVDITAPTVTCGDTMVTIPKYTALPTANYPTANEDLRTITLTPKGATSTAIFYVQAPSGASGAPANTVSFTYAVTDLAGNAATECTKTITLTGLSAPTLTIADWTVFKVSIPGSGSLDAAAAATAITNGVTAASATITYTPALPTPLLDGLDSTKLNTQLTTKAKATDTAGNIAEQDLVIKITADACAQNTLVLGSGIQIMGTFSASATTLQCTDTANTVLASTTATGTTLQVACSTSTNPGIWTNSDAAMLFLGNYDISGTKAVGAPPACVATTPAHIETMKTVTFATTTVASAACLATMQSTFQTALNAKATAYQLSANLALSNPFMNPPPVVVTITAEASLPVATSANLVTFMYKYIIKATASATYDNLVSAKANCEMETSSELATSFPTTPTGCPALPAPTYTSTASADACEDGYIVDATNHRCVPCPAGSYFMAGECKPCPQGMYSSALHATSCQTCDAMKSTYAVGATSVDLCVYKCAQYGMKSGQADGLWPCSACPANMKPNPDDPTACIACVTGDPAPCPANQCPAGQYSVDSSGTGTCMPCPRHTYQNSAGQAYCFLCPTATPYTASTGSTDMATQCVAIPADCGTTMCNGHGSCMIEGGLLFCECTGASDTPPQYIGPSCEAINYCSSNPCYNSGACAMSTTTPFYTCTCTGGASGTMCETPNDHCSGVSCGTGGQCYNTATGYTCKCPAGSSGSNCQNTANPCDGNTCARGTCVAVGTAWYTCTCPAGYTGDLCDSDINECDSAPCGWGGTCTQGVNSYTCMCVDGSTGSSCNEPTTTCSTNPCSSTGSCYFDLLPLRTSAMTVATGTMCLCNQYFTANPAASITVASETAVSVPTASMNAACMTPACPTTNPCTGHGTCTTPNNVPTCTCTDDLYQGPLCQYDVNECLISGFCGHGTCANTEGGFTCTCDAGYIKDADMKCTTEQFCTADPSAYCGAQGTCIALDTCQCSAGYTGQPCVDINECDSNPCLYGGVCTTPNVNAFMCECPTGFTGARCEILPSNPCTASSCNSHGDCLQFNNLAYCKCNEGYYGDQCQTAVNLCSASPCLNGGACQVSGSTVSCECTNDYSGDYCQFSKDPCARCVVGTCVPALDASTCSCYGDFTGDYCQTSTNDCATNPCGSSSQCIDGNGEYFCNCANILKTGYSCNKDKDFSYNMYFTSKSGRASSPYPFTLGGKDFTIYLRVQYDASADSTGTFFTLYGSELQYNIATSKELLSVDDTKVTLKFGTETAELNFLASLHGPTSSERIVLIKYTSASNTLQLVVNLNPDASLTTYMLATGTTLPQFGRIVLGSPSGSTGFKGYVSEVFMWNNPTTVADNVLNVVGNIATLTTGLVTTWFDFQLESGCYTSARSTTSSTPGSVPTAPSITCIADQNVDLSERSPGSAASWSATVTSTGTLTAIYPTEHVFGWGIYSNAITACTNNLCSLCTYKIYVKHAPSCTDFTLPTTTADWTCSGTSCVQACTDTNLIQTPAPVYFTCGKGGSFSVANTNLKLILPSCVASTSVINTLQINVTYANVDQCPIRISAGQGSPAVTTAKAAVTANCATCPDTTVALECVDPPQTCGTESSSSTQSMLITINTVTTDTVAASGAVDAIVAGITGPTSTPSGVKSTIVTSCAAGSALSADGQKCIQCMAGTFLNTAGTCEPCPLNKYQAMAGQTSCTDCPANKVTVVTGAAAMDKCIDPCPVGKKYETSACVDCPVGYYQNMTGQAFCYPCPAGLTCVAGSDAYSDCTGSCPAGQQLDPNDVGQCVPCPLGTYKTAEGPENCTACPAGQTTTATGQTSVAMCAVSTNTYTFVWVINITFPADTTALKALLEAHLNSQLQTTVTITYISIVPGSVQVTGTATATGVTDAQLQAAMASYPSTTSASVVSNPDNTVCMDGMYLNTAATPLACAPCPVNTYQPAGDMNVCRSCNTYYITASTGQTASSACTLSCPAGTMVSGDTCAVCPAHTYQSGTNQATCMNCPANTATSGTGKTQASDCIAVVNECATASANNCTPSASGGVCTDLPAGFMCSCNSSYTGNGVGTDGCKHLCDTPYCQNGGTCVRTNNPPTCSCTSNYQGTTCTQRIAQSSNEATIIGGVVGGIVGFLLLLGLCLLIAKNCAKPSPKKSAAPAQARNPQQQPYMYPNYGVTTPSTPVFPSNVHRPPMYFPVEGTFAQQAPRDATSNMGYSNTAGQGTNSPFWIYDEY